VAAIASLLLHEESPAAATGTADPAPGPWRTLGNWRL